MKTLLGTALVVALAAATPALAASNAAQLQSPDQDFLTNAAEGNVSEVKLGQLAEMRAANTQVKSFGKQMVTDHSKAQKDLQQAMSGMDVVVPDHVTKDAAGLYDQLATETGAQFDQDYMNAMVKDHKNDIDAFNDQIKNGKVQKLRSYAENTLPVLQKHLQMAQQINQVAQNEKSR